MNSVFTYLPGDSFLHRAHPVAKLFAAFAVCVAAAICPSSVFVLALILLQLAVAVPCGCLKQCLKLVAALGGLALIVLLLQVLCVRTGIVYFQAGPLMVTHDGVTSGILVLLKVVCMVLPLSIAFMTTQITHLTNELVHKCHLPYKYAFTITTAIRFIPVFMEEMAGIMEAQKARGIQFDTGNVLKKLRLMVPLCVPLLVHSVKRTDSIAVAAELRGFNLRTRTSALNVQSFALRDFVLAVACVALFAAAVVL